MCGYVAAKQGDAYLLLVYLPDQVPMWGKKGST